MIMATEPDHDEPERLDERFGDYMRGDLRRMDARFAAQLRRALDNGYERHTSLRNDAVLSVSPGP